MNNNNYSARAQAYVCAMISNPAFLEAVKNSNPHSVVGISNIAFAIVRLEKELEEKLLDKDLEDKS